MARFFEGIGKTINELRNYPHGVVSRNSHQNISNNLQRHGILNYFLKIIGYEEVDFARQKPHPKGLLTCISWIKKIQKGDFVIYIGDHETDAQCAFNANIKLKRKAILSIGAMFEKPDMTNDWKYKPDFIVFHPSDVVNIVEDISKS